MAEHVEETYTLRGGGLPGRHRRHRPLYRFYNKKNGSHFYTASLAERDSVIARYGSVYHYEGVAYDVSLVAAGNQPVYRFYNKKNGSHFYTASLRREGRCQGALRCELYAYDGPVLLRRSVGPLRNDWFANEEGRPEGRPSVASRSTRRRRRLCRLPLAEKDALPGGHELAGDRADGAVPDDMVVELHDRDDPARGGGEERLVGAVRVFQRHHAENDLVIDRGQLQHERSDGAPEHVAVRRAHDPVGDDVEARTRCLGDELAVVVEQVERALRRRSVRGAGAS